MLGLLFPGHPAGSDLPQNPGGERPAQDHRPAEGADHQRRGGQDVPHSETSLHLCKAGAAHLSPAGSLEASRGSGAQAMDSPCFQEVLSSQRPAWAETRPRHGER
ncbi:hypothetical protein Y1Q_0024000 [Alligator mississippiensis]|uniref:Uncharacterized protein n=1 Tax=Alligator mississippiensis TaxID=8496 RepID=A0A151MW97_ALLMI|nr:hypothetical protein Y1Q_0024000 [Alligator mississippiensis]